MQRKENQKVLYPELEHLRTHKIQVDPKHTLYVEESGNLKGIPVLFLHGGPGGKTHPSDRRYFDPAKYRIILFDQRGAGQSTPFAELEDNTSAHLVDDIEKIREYLSIESMLIFGGSWGSTLGLLYFIKYPSRVLGMILRGIFLGTQAELDWFYEGYGAQNIYPDAYQDFLSPLKEAKRGSIIKEFASILSDNKHPQYAAAIKAWSTWEGSTLGLESKKEIKEVFLEEKLQESIAKIECHYFSHQLFMKDNFIIESIKKMETLPSLEIIHGRYDVICPLSSAWSLHQAYKGSSLHICEASGHTASEPRITQKLIELLDQFEL